MAAFDDPGRQADAALLAAYAAGDSRAAQTVVADHLPRVLGLARRMLGNEAEAEEVAQEAVLRLWKVAPEWRAGEARISTWLYRVTANLCTDRQRRVRSQGIAPASGTGMDPTDHRPGVEARIMDNDRRSALDAALAMLPERQRLAVVLRHLEERANPEIAEILEISVEAVESLIARGKRGLAEQLRPMGAALGYEDTGS